MTETKENFNILKSSIDKFKQEIQKFISDPNYGKKSSLTHQQFTI